MIVKILLQIVAFAVGGGLIWLGKDNSHVVFLTGIYFVYVGLMTVFADAAKLNSPFKKVLNSKILWGILFIVFFLLLILVVMTGIGGQFSFIFK